MPSFFDFDNFGKEEKLESKSYIYIEFETEGIQKVACLMIVTEREVPA